MNRAQSESSFSSSSDESDIPYLPTPADEVRIEELINPFSNIGEFQEQIQEYLAKLDHPSTPEPHNTGLRVEGHDITIIDPSLLSDNVRGFEYDWKKDVPATWEAPTSAQNLFRNTISDAIKKESVDEDSATVSPQKTVSDSFDPSAQHNSTPASNQAVFNFDLKPHLEPLPPLPILKQQHKALPELDPTDVVFFTDDSGDSSNETSDSDDDVPPLVALDHGELLRPYGTHAEAFLAPGSREIAKGSSYAAEVHFLDFAEDCVVTGFPIGEDRTFRKYEETWEHLYRQNFPLSANQARLQLTREGKGRE